MTTTGTRSRLLLAGCIWMLLLAALIGFTAEPSTSTQFDAREGRGVFVVQPPGHQLLVADLADVMPGRQAAALLTLVTALLLAGGAALVVAEGDGQRRRTVLGWARAARRGPPALV